MSGLLPTSFMHWQEKSVLFEERASVPARNTFVSRQRDRTLYFPFPEVTPTSPQAGSRAARPGRMFPRHGCLRRRKSKDLERAGSKGRADQKMKGVVFPEAALLSPCRMQVNPSLGTSPAKGATTTARSPTDHCTSRKAPSSILITPLSRSNVSP